MEVQTAKEEVKGREDGAVQQGVGEGWELGGWGWRADRRQGVSGGWARAGFQLERAWSGSLEVC